MHLPIYPAGPARQPLYQRMNPPTACSGVTLIRAALQKVFDEFDQDLSGRLDGDEIQAALFGGGGGAPPMEQSTINAWLSVRAPKLA